MDKVLNLLEKEQLNATRKRKKSLMFGRIKISEITCIFLYRNPKARRPAYAEHAADMVDGSKVGKGQSEKARRLVKDNLN